MCEAIKSIGKNCPQKKCCEVLFRSTTPCPLVLSLKGAARAVAATRSTGSGVMTIRFNPFGVCAFARLPASLIAFFLSPLLFPLFRHFPSPLSSKRLEFFQLDLEKRLKFGENLAKVKGWRRGTKREGLNANPLHFVFFN